MPSNSQATYRLLTSHPLASWPTMGNYRHTKLYLKPTDIFDYLHWSSYYLHHTKRSIPYSLAFKLVRICSSEAALTRRLTDLKHHLKRSGFPHKHIQAAMSKLEVPRSKALKRKDRLLTVTQRIPLVLKYSLTLPNIPYILKKIFPHHSNVISGQKTHPDTPHGSFPQAQKPP